MAKSIVMNVLTSLGYEPMYPFNPANLLYATVLGTSNANNYNLNIPDIITPITTDYGNNMGIICFVPTVTNNANATITINGSTSYGVYFENGVQIGDGILVEEQPVFVKFVNGNFYLLMSKAQIGLGNVDNTADMNKPISTAAQAALDGKLNIPVSIPNNANLNTYTASGLFFNNSTSATISNRPPNSTGMTFGLWVMNNGNGVTQIASLGQTGNILYQRNLYNGTWGSWQAGFFGSWGTVAPVNGTGTTGNVYYKYTT